MAPIDFDGDVGQFRMNGELIAKVVIINVCARYDAEHASELALANTPDMQVGDDCCRVALRNDVAHFINDWRVHFRIKQNAAAVAQQAQRPAGDEHGTHNAHGRVQPAQAW